MGGERISLFLNNEVTAILTTYKQFETLVPGKNRSGSAHSGEDGRERKKDKDDKHSI